jgi:hypothetical protein
MRLINEQKMGVFRYTTFLRDKSKKNKLDVIPLVDYCFIDGNCVIYDAFSKLTGDISELPKQVRALCETWNNKIKAKRQYIVFDGIPPLPKRKCQKERRSGNITRLSYVLPNTPIMNAIASEFEFEFDEFSPNYIGEGEHKIFKHIRTHIDHYRDKSIIVHSVDSDVILLCQILEKEFQLKLYVLNYNDYYAGVADISGINAHLFNNWSIEKLLIFTYLAGNDYVKTIPTVPVIRDIYKSLNNTNLDTINLKKNCCKNIKDYICLWQWYYEYYTTSSPVEMGQYTMKLPCFFCFLSNRLIKEYETHHITITHEEHLSEIFGTDYKINLNYDFPTPC